MKKTSRRKVATCNVTAAQSKRSAPKSDEHVPSHLLEPTKSEPLSAQVIVSDRVCRSVSLWVICADSRNVGNVFLRAVKTCFVLFFVSNCSFRFFAHIPWIDGSQFLFLPFRSLGLTDCVPVFVHKRWSPSAVPHTGGDGRAQRTFLQFKKWQLAHPFPGMFTLSDAQDGVWTCNDGG